jgi:hypothetical protein
VPCLDSDVRLCLKKKKHFYITEGRAACSKRTCALDLNKQWTN